jgi:hypothetical protein
LRGRLAPAAGLVRGEWVPPPRDEPWMDAYDTRRPDLGVSSIRTTAGEIFTYEYGLSSLRKCGTTIEQFVAMEDCGDLASMLLDLVAWRARSPRKEL